MLLRSFQHLSLKHTGAELMISLPASSSAANRAEFPCLALRFGTIQAPSNRWHW